ncbi:hypothetical protein, partial [Neotabrizicola sp. sgz301269]|uniref:hypothetical protein n=1 Tax=Neotabrizicola sp. sgz301269 TaxID=3276282 RepID=UPI00376FD76A
ASVGSHNVRLRGVFDLGIGMPSDQKTASVAALSTFPSLVGTPASGSDTGTTRNITFTNAIGNLLCLVISPDGTSDLGAPAGWEKVSPGTLRDPSLHVYFKKASSVNEVVTITSASEAVQWFPIVIKDWLDTGTITDTLVIGAIAENYGASTLTLDAPSVTNTHGTEKVLWMLLVANSGLYPAQTSAPSGWTGFQSHETGNQSSDARVGICFRQEEIATMDPAAWPTATRIAMTRVIGIRPGAGASAVALSGASLTISPESPVETDTTTFAFSFAAGTTPATTSLTINGVTTTTTTGVHTRTLPAGSYPYTWSSSNAAGAGPSGSGTLVVAAAPTITASVSLSPSSPTAGQIVTATVTVSPTDATPGLSVVNGGSPVTITPGVPGVWTFTAPATGTTTVTPTATLDATVVSGTPATFSTGAAPVSANAPKLWGVPEVGDLLEFIAGTGVSSPSYLIERTDNGGSTYATEKTATAGE